MKHVLHNNLNSALLQDYAPIYPAKCILFDTIIQYGYVQMKLRLSCIGYETDKNIKNMFYIAKYTLEWFAYNQTYNLDRIII